MWKLPALVERQFGLGSWMTRKMKADAIEGGLRWMLDEAVSWVTACLVFCKVGGRKSERKAGRLMGLSMAVYRLNYGQSFSLIKLSKRKRVNGA
jgi:hypothetical protein